MKIFKYILTATILMAMLTSCYEEEYWLEDNITTEGNHFPIIQTVEVEGDTDPGSNIGLVMHYWSDDPILQHELYDSIVGFGAEELYATTAYSYNYDSEAGSEVVTLPYGIPNDAELPFDTTDIVLRIVVVNENGLTRESTTSIRVIK